jgi:RNA-directed DNA polymerase
LDTTSRVEGTEVAHVAVTAQDKADLADWVQRRAQPWTPWPVKRGVCAAEERASPTARNSRDRRQGTTGPDRQRTGARVGSTIEPRSYGFRPARDCHDAIKAIHQAGKGRNAKLPVKIAISTICAG